jgi:hypothetical protein
MDATFNEHYIDVTGGAPLGVRELNQRTLAGQLATVVPVKHGYPTDLYASNSYIGWASRPGLDRHGFRQYAIFNYMNFANGAGRHTSRLNVLVYSPQVPLDYQPLPGEELNYERDPARGGWYFWPRINDAAKLDYPLDVTVIDSEVKLLTSSTGGFWGIGLSVKTFLPYANRFEIFTDKNQYWAPVQTILTPGSAPAVSQQISVPFGSGLLKIRAGDTVNNVTRPVIIRVY